MTSLTFKPIKLETVVVMRGSKVAGTIKRYRSHGGCIASVPGIYSPETHRGACFFKTIGEAKAAILAADAA